MLRAGCGPFSKLHPSDDFDLDGSKRTVCCDELTLLSSCSIRCEIFFCPQRSAHHCDDDDDDDGDDDDDDDEDDDEEEEEEEGEAKEEEEDAT